jgi:putative nucleotidyltransferase with HDIG domain
MMAKRQKGRKNKERFSLKGVLAAARTERAKCAFVAILGMVALAVLFGAAIAPERYNLKVGSIAFKTITASKDVVDETTTARRREEAAKQVEPSYHPKDGVTDTVMSDLRSVFEELRRVQQYGQTLVSDTPQQPEEDTNIISRRYSQGELDYARDMLTTITLADYQVATLLQTPADVLEQAYNDVSAALRNTLNTTIREGQINESINNILQIVGFKTDTSLLQNVISPVLRRVIQPNMVIDQEATAIAQENARKAVEPVMYNQGQNIVVAGERVSANQLEMLRTLGLLDDNSVDVPMYLGSTLLIVAVMLLTLALLTLMNGSLMQDFRKMVVFMLIMNLSLAICIVFVKVMNVNVYLSPVILGALLLTGLLGPLAGIAGNLALSVIVSALSAGGNNEYSAVMIHLLLSSVVGGTVAVMALRGKSHRAQALLCGIYAALSSLVVMTAVGLMTNNDAQAVFTNALWSMGGAVIAALLCMGFQPLLEIIFNLATPSKLMELANPNQPLLRRLLIEAPGTYHHSIIVANLSEAAAEAIGANPLLARVGSYFHDVGKLKRPLYFKENQMGDNPHDHTDPYVSSAIVTAHARDGLQMAQKYRLPVEIEKIIMEHHGDTPVMYFYHKALQQADGNPVDIQDFRYDGTRPTMKESAIVMLADTIEAAVRSMPDPTPQRIEEFIEQLVRGKLEDGQLSDSPLTLRDIDKICDAFSTVLIGVFHERIEYPAVEIQKKEPPVPARLTEAEPVPAPAPEPAPLAVKEMTEKAAAEKEENPPATAQEDGKEPEKSPEEKENLEE